MGSKTRFRKVYLGVAVGVLGLVLAVLSAVFTGGSGAPARPEAATGVVPAAVVDEPVPARPGSATAVLAGGCFWGVQGVFQHVKGVSQAVSGYTGGSAATAHYAMIGTGLTGHAESVRITYDPQQVTYGQLLRIFFSVHDPTQVDQQGPDSGSQYRSAIFPRNDDQRRVAESYLAQLTEAKVFGEPIATRVEPAGDFFPAEEHHQDFLSSHPNSPYIAINDLPKVDELKRLFPELYREQPALVLAQN